MQLIDTILEAMRAAAAQDERRHAVARANALWALGLDDDALEREVDDALRADRRRATRTDTNDQPSGWSS